MIALFEIVPTEINKGAIKDDFTTGKLADLKLKYHLPGHSEQENFCYTSRFDFIPFNELDKCYHFSAAVALFGSLLRSSQFIKNADWDDLISLSESSLGSGNDLLQKEFLSLVQQAKSLYTKTKRKKGGTADW
jgi:Ca-activated chloride channel family protein